MHLNRYEKKQPPSSRVCSKSFASKSPRYQARAIYSAQIAGLRSPHPVSDMPCAAAIAEVALELTAIGAHSRSICPFKPSHLASCGLLGELLLASARACSRDALPVARHMSSLPLGAGGRVGIII